MTIDKVCPICGCFLHIETRDNGVKYWICSNCIYQVDELKKGDEDGAKICNET